MKLNGKYRRKQVKVRIAGRGNCHTEVRKNIERGRGGGQMYLVEICF